MRDSWRTCCLHSSSGIRLSVSLMQSTLRYVGASVIISLLCIALHPLRSSSIMDSEQRAELLTILARESYFERELTLASGRASNYYIDCKRTLYLPRGAYLVGEAVFELVMSEGVGQLGGMAAGALPGADAGSAAAPRHGAANLRGLFRPHETKQHVLPPIVA